MCSASGRARRHLGVCDWAELFGSSRWVWFATGVVVTLLATVIVMQAWRADAAPGDLDSTLHVDAALSNFLVQEICSGVEPTRKEKIWEEWLGFPAMRMVCPPRERSRLCNRWI